jgi:hypothetical protein
MKDKAHDLSCNPGAKEMLERKQKILRNGWGLLTLLLLTFPLDSLPRTLLIFQVSLSKKPTEVSRVINVLIWVI